MSLTNALLHSINKEWSMQEDGELFEVLTTVTIHTSLAEAIRNSGEEVPEEFDPDTFNYGEEGNYSEVGIEVSEQDELIIFHYE